MCLPQSWRKNHSENLLIFFGKFPWNYRREKFWLFLRTNFCWLLSCVFDFRHLHCNCRNLLSCNFNIFLWTLQLLLNLKFYNRLSSFLPEAEGPPTSTIRSPTPKIFAEKPNLKNWNFMSLFMSFHLIFPRSFLRKIYFSCGRQLRWNEFSLWQ